VPARLTSFRRDDPHAGLLRFAVDDAGPPDGEVVVCLHGFPQDRRAYARVTPLLAAAGRRVLVPDQRGVSTARTTSAWVSVPRAGSTPSSAT